MAELQDTDKLLVNRDGQSHFVETQNLMNTIQDTDLLLVNRSDVSYKVTGLDLKDSLNNEVDPDPDSIVIEPSVPGSGTELDPYILTPITVQPAGATGTSVESITITGREGQLVVWLADNTRFQQPVNVFDETGQWTGQLVYQDTPLTLSNTNYIGNLQIGTTYFQWQVNQLTTGSTYINELNLTEDDPAGARFNSQSFLATTKVIDGFPIGTKTFEAHVNGTTSSKTQFDEPLDSYSETTTGEWTRISQTTVAANDIVYGLGRSVVTKSAFPWLMESTDFVTWNNVNISSDPGKIFNGIAVGTASTGANAGSEMFVAVGVGIGAYSLDGVTWESYTITQTIDGVQSDVALPFIQYANGVFVALGTSITAYSTDGVTWTLATVPEAEGFSPTELVYGTPSTGPDAGTPVFIGFSSAVQRTITSYDGINWVYTRGDTLVRQYGAAYGNGKFVTVARTGEVRWSTDGLNWNLVKISKSVNLSHVAFGNDRFVAVTNAANTVPVFIYSYDGMDWVETPYIANGAGFGNLKFIEGMFVALAANEFTVSASGTGDNEQVLNFANGTDMSPLAVGDRISQARSFNAQVTSSLTQTTNIDETWANFIIGEGAASYIPENIFNGDLTTAALANKTITWDTSTFPLSGTLGLVVQKYTSATTITVEHGGGTYKQNFLTTTAAQTGSSANIKLIELPYLSNITSVNVNRGNTSTYLYGIILDGEIVTTGTRLEINRTTLSLPDGTDVSQIAVGDIVTGNTLAYDNSKLWREAPIFDDGGYAPIVTFENTCSISNAFNSEKCYNYIRSASPELGGTWTLNFTDFDDAEEIVIYIAAAGQCYSVNGVAKDAGPQEIYKVIPIDLTGQGLQQFTWSQVDISNYCYLLAMEVDGQLLVDSDVDRFKEPEVVGTTSEPVTVTVSPSTWANGAEVSIKDANIVSTITYIEGETVNTVKYPSTWVVGTNVTGPEKTQVTANTRLYCEFDSQGNITDLLQEPQDPPYTTQDSNPSLTFTFPATFPSGSTPDEELTAGTTFTVDVTSANTTSLDFRTASVQPGETLVQFDEPLESSNIEPLRYSDYLLGSFDIESRFAFGAGDGFNANTTNSSAYALTTTNNKKVVFDCSSFPLTGEIIWSGGTELNLSFTVTSIQGVKTYWLEGTAESTFNMQYKLPSLTEITRIEVQGEEPLVIRGISVNRMTLTDGDTNVKSLNFADGTDMVTLSTGDTVTQQRSFSETVETSTSQAVTIEKVWADYVDSAVLNGSYPATNAFDGNLTTLAYPLSNDAVFVWDTSTFPLTGSLSIGLSLDKNNEYVVNIYHENGVHSEVFINATLSDFFNTALKKYVAPVLFNIRRVEVLLKANKFRVYGIALDDVLFKTGTPMIKDTSVLTFADGTDMSYLQPGDKLTGNLPYWNQSTTWSEAPILDNNGFNAQYPVTQGFDGNTYPINLNSCALPQNGGNFTFNFTQFDDASIVKLNIFSRISGLKVNGEEITLSSTAGWYEILVDVTGQGLQSIDISYISPAYAGLKSVEVDGRLLVDAGVIDYVDASNWNQSREWSDSPTQGSATTANYEWSNIFSKEPDPVSTAYTTVISSRDEPYRITFLPPIPVNNKLEILGARGNINDSTKYYDINDGEQFFLASVLYASAGTIGAWDIIPDVTELSSLEISYPTAVSGQNRYGAVVSGIRIDDKLLVDSSVIPSLNNFDRFPVTCVSVNSIPPTATTTDAGWTAGSVLSNGDQESTGTVDDIVDTTVTLTPSSSITWVDGINVTGPVTAATRSQSPEEFSESQARFITYSNRSMIKCGEDALAQRQAVIDEAVDLGVDISGLYDSN